ncbi:MAG: polysaccharide deacetylase family protein [Candidatus Thiodiazotropha sp. (ex Ctena orbiculata)]|nr:polysaccharide deacetylase family protein [Candidatus Thiodiazotropha taylori]MBT3001177.1 polysaccharide deacetylase family protein [Candidatus Thiodiazotropha taylori]MBV2107419.1 polysaccharide deacetylase family protein [Candidatus Thiodiazotropha taylori]MBV2112025.1 polysaccharide deacetylase family protein [Candidatus Thiodiazotropha taylori]
MQKLKHIIKSMIANILYYSGVLHLIKHYRLSSSCIVLTYHRVLDDKNLQISNSNPSIIVDVDLFEEQIKFLQANFSILSLSDLQQGIYNEKFEDGSCLITFDDGWVDNYLYAYPILKKYSVPATIFLATDYIGSDKSFWQEELTGIIKSSFHDKDSVALKILDLENILELSESEALIMAQEKIQDLKRLPDYELHDLISRLKKIVVQHADSSGVDKFLNWDQVKEMQSGNITFASHGCSHSIMTKISKDQLQYELEESSAVIKSKTGIYSYALAYPNGNFDESMTRVVSTIYDLAFATESGPIQPGDNKYSLKRVNIHTGATNTKQLFFCKILGLL